MSNSVSECFDIGQLEKRYHLNQNEPRSLHKLLLPANKWNPLSYITVISNRIVHLVRFKQKISNKIIHESLKRLYGKDAQIQCKHFRNLAFQGKEPRLENQEKFISQWNNLQKLMTFFKGTVLQNALGKILNMEEWTKLHSSFQITPFSTGLTPASSGYVQPPPPAPNPPPVLAIPTPLRPLRVRVMEEGGALNHVTIEPKKNVIEQILEDENSRAAQVFKLADLKAREIEAAVTPELKVKLEKEAAAEGAFCDPDEWEDEETPISYDAEGYSPAGFDAEGFNKQGFNAEGFNKEGFDKDGFNAYGYDAEGFDKEGWSRYGHNKKGEFRDPSTVKKPVTEEPVDLPGSTEPVETAAPTTPRKINPDLLNKFGGKANSHQTQSFRRVV